MTLAEIGWPQISGGCPCKVLNSQWVPTRPETRRDDEMNVYNVTDMLKHIHQTGGITSDNRNY